jgi:hypothetical protein
MFTWGSRANSHQPLGGIPPMSIPELTFAAHKTMVETTSRSVLLYHNRSHFFFWRNHGPRHCEIAPAYFGANYHLPLMPLLQSPAQSTSGFSVPRPAPDQNTPAATGYRSLPGRYDPFPQSSLGFQELPLRLSIRKRLSQLRNLNGGQLRCFRHGFRIHPRQ